MINLLLKFFGLTVFQHAPVCVSPLYLSGWWWCSLSHVLDAVSQRPLRAGNHNLNGPETLWQTLNVSKVLLLLMLHRW